jgi:predicted nucleic acid-binding protein
MLMVDSSVWIDYFGRNQTPHADLLDTWLLNGERTILVGDLVLHEVLRGFRGDGQFRRAAALLGQLPSESLCNETRALTAADRYRQLRKRGVTIRSTLDCLIASWCIDESIPLLADDRDFGPYAEHLGLQLLAA